MNFRKFLGTHRKQAVFFVLGVLFGGFALFVSPGGKNFTAGILPPNWDQPFHGVDELIEPPAEGNAVDKVKYLFWQNIVPIFKYLMVVISIFYFILYLYQMLTSSGEEEAITSSTKNLLWGVLGFMVIALAMDIAESFDIWRNNGEFVDKAHLENAQLRVISYFQLLAAIVAFFYIFFAGFRLVTAHGDEEIITAQKNHIKWGFVGLMFVMLADVAVNRIFYPSQGQKGLGKEELTTLFSEGVGVLRFFLAFVGILAVVSLIASGVIYITSGGDEAATGKAKKNIFGSLIAIIIIVMSYIFVASFVPPGPVQ